MSDVRKCLHDAGLPYECWEAAWKFVEEGMAIMPDVEPPHLSPLGRLLGDIKVKGTHRRPFGCLCYPSVAKRLPSGTLE